jgi:hypothetical protein
MFRGSLFQRGVFVSFFSSDFELFLALHCHFGLVCRFSCLLLALRVFLLLDDILEFFLALWSSSCASCVLDLKFKIYAFCCQCTHQGGDWEIKWSISWFDYDESLIYRGLNSNAGYFGCFTPICSCVESRLLISWCVGDRCNMADNGENHQ